jgi:hypothetical protein
MRSNSAHPILPTAATHSPTDIVEGQPLGRRLDDPASWELVASAALGSERQRDECAIQGVCKLAIDRPGVRTQPIPKGAEEHLDYEVKVDVGRYCAAGLGAVEQLMKHGAAPREEVVLSR